MTTCSETSARLVDQLGVPPQIIPQLYVCPVKLDPDKMPEVTSEDLRYAQEKDTVIGLVKKAVESGSILSMPKSLSPNVVLMQRQGNKLMVRNQLLYRVTKDEDGKDKSKLVLPNRYHFQVMKSLHDDGGHIGVGKKNSLKIGSSGQK